MQTFRDWAQGKVEAAATMNIGSGAQIRQLLFAGAANEKAEKGNLELERAFKVASLASGMWTWAGHAACWGSTCYGASCKRNWPGRRSCHPPLKCELLWDRTSHICEDLRAVPGVQASSPSAGTRACAQACLTHAGLQFSMHPWS